MIYEFALFTRLYGNGSGIIVIQNMLIYQGITYLFIPICIETFGSWGNMGHKLIKDIGKKLKEASGEPRSTFFLTQRISIAIQRGNASCILGTVPFSIGLDSMGQIMYKSILR